MRDLRVEVMLEVVEVLERDEREHAAAEESRLLQLGAAARIVRNEGGDERKDPAARDHQRGVRERERGDRDDRDADPESDYDRRRLGDHPRAIASVLL